MIFVKYMCAVFIPAGNAEASPTFGFNPFTPRTYNWSDTNKSILISNDFLEKYSIASSLTVSAQQSLFEYSILFPNI